MLAVALAAGCGVADDDSSSSLDEDTAVSTQGPESTFDQAPPSTSDPVTSVTNETCRAETAAPWLLTLDDLEYTSVDRYRERLPAHIEIQEMFPPGGPPIEYWLAATEVMVAPDGSWNPGITAGVVRPDGVKIEATPCVAELVADELARRGVPIVEIVLTDGEPMVAVEADGASPTPPISTCSPGEPWPPGCPNSIWSSP